MRDAVVIGAGVFGTWTAHHLLRAGLRVTLVDAYGPGNLRSSSGDESRILRCGYGGDEIYSAFARRSLGMWRDLQDRRQVPLFVPCGVLWLAAGDDAYTAATRQTLAAGGYAVEVLDGRALHDRYPQLAAADIPVALLEPGSGVLLARRAVRALASELASSDVRTVRGRVQPLRDADERGPALRRVVLDSGDAIDGDAFVFACGPWLPRVLPDAIGARIRPTRQAVIYFGTPAGDTRFGAESMPAWIDFPSGIYGVPEVDARGVKVGIDAHGPPIDPDADDRVVTADQVARARAWLARRVPALAAAPVVDTRVCAYENTATGDFLVDRHPRFDNVWMAGGGSGHGFKHGPAVGEYVARLVTEGASAEPRFAWASKRLDPARSVF